MGLLNYTTSIDAWQTVSEIQQLLARAGATHFSIRNEGISPAAITFAVDYNGRPLNFLLPCNIEGVKRFMETDKPTRDRLVKAGKMKTIDQHALNVGWRVVKDWIEAQVALIQIDMATIEEIFMPYLVIDAKGTTLSQKMLKGDGFKMLNY
jgi:hypothetical protein